MCLQAVTTTGYWTAVGEQLACSSEWGVADWARWANRLGYGKRSKQQNVSERQRSSIRAGDFASAEGAKNL